VLKQAVSQDKNDADAWYYLGLALLEDPKARKEASRAFETATKLRPNFAAAHAGFAYLLLLRNKETEAAHEARAALALDPKIPNAHYILGVTQLKTSKAQALENAEAEIKLQPEFGAAYLLKSLALVLFSGDVMLSEEDESSESREVRYRQAADTLEKFLQLSPRDPYRDTWTRQLESLRFFASPKSGEARLVYSGRQVTTKANVISKPEPGYTETARAAGITGKVVLRCVFTAEGEVKHFLIVKPLAYGLTEQAIKAARRIKFIPATADGHPVSMYIQLEYNFSLY